MKKSSRQISLRGLRTFTVAARHGSFRAAADELFVTASAVSHQVKSLEDELGVTLFARGGGGIDLTASGQALYEQVAPLIRQLDEITASFAGRASRYTLRVSVQPFFASELFVPRLAHFTELHPEIDIHVDTSDESPEKHPASADVSIRLFRSAPTELRADPLFPLRVVAACAPELKRKLVGSGKGKRKSGDEGIKPFPIVVHASRVSDWQTWAESSGIDMPEPSATVHLNSMTAVVRAAEKGVGVALVPMPLCQSRFDAGQLVTLYDAEVPTGEVYHLVHADDPANARAVAALRNWVLQEFAPQR